MRVAHIAEKTILGDISINNLQHVKVNNYILRKIILLTNKTSFSVMKCQRLELENGKVLKQNLTVNSTINFACKKGYERKGIPSRKCVSNTTTAYWDPSDSVSCQGLLEIDRLELFTLYIIT